MSASDITATRDQALAAPALIKIPLHRPRLLSDDGASYVADGPARWLEYKGMQYVRGTLSKTGQLSTRPNRT